jgi:hypothetical protein
MQRILIGILGSLSVILITILIIGTLALDKEGPRIEYSERQLIYSDEIDMSDFITDVIATDAKEGDVSSTLIIERVIKMKSVNVAVIIYAAKDSSNNITQKERIVKYIPNDAKESVQPSEIYVKSEVSNNESFYAPSEDVSVLDNLVQVVEQEPDRVQLEVEQPEVEQPDAITIPNTEVLGNNELSLEEARANALETKIPYIRLNTYSARLKVGDIFNYANYIDYAVDDVDDVYRTIIVSRNYNTSEPGVYDVSFYVTDSDGNRSNIEVLKLTVEE